MIRFLSLTLLILASGAVCFSQIAPAPVAKSDAYSRYDDADAFDVYSAVLPTTWPMKEANAKSLVIRSEANNYEMCLQPKFDSEAVIGSAIKSYVELTKKNWLLAGKLTLDRPYKFVQSAIIDADKSEDYWGSFNKAFPNSWGYTEVSPVGFNPEKTVAVLYVGHSCGPRCGGGQFYVLTKSNGKWIPLHWVGSHCWWNS